MPQCIPIRDLKDTAAVSQMCKTAKEPIYITKNGYNDMVIMSSEMYERIRLFSVYEKLMEAEENIRLGQVKDARLSLKNMREKYGL